VVDREQHLVDAARGAITLHLGCADVPRHRDGHLLHDRLAAVAKHLVGVEQDEEAVHYLQNVLGRKDVVRGDVEQLEKLELEQTFDVVIAGELLEHLTNPGACLRGVRSLLRPAGRLVISVPNASSLKGFARVVRGVEMVHPDHVAYFSPTTVERLLARHGYRVISCVYYTWSSQVRWKRVLDTMLLAPVRRFAPYISDGLIVTARMTDQ
jgi:2-polyprenyl-3-methyl-5-hydroxy-6-metoxy-1,4-benzoquinol methylase